MPENNTSSERTEIWYGIDNIISRSLEVLSKIETTYNLCLDRTGVSPILETEPIKKDFTLELKNRGSKDKDHNRNYYTIIFTIAKR